ncbi:ATP-dependent DNA helicase RecG [Actinobacillus delphinicola]|uniref:ATP-dependent DNA helicase RecG n=1 Tax=Actinobacillus delphinicola TaxID=51161 RepID=A0A448TUI0_9PAST|nr:ATP-dependent DNA helicase RecG [Actinobacillus delphinicola]VEJ09644.1 ATP-dependent DNA helicase RecG [Actinobacillus delphinicola]
MADIFLDEIPLSTLKGVGKAMTERLNKLGIFNLQDLLLHLPSRYEDRTKITPLSEIRVDQHTTIEGFVQLCEVVVSRRPMLLVTLSDGTSKIQLRFFNFNAGMKNSFQVGVKVRAFGEIKRGRFMAEMAHPEYQILQPNQIAALSESFTPIYPTTEGMSQAMWRKLIPQALKSLDNYQVSEILPKSFNPYPFELKEALQFLHCPPANTLLNQLEEGSHPAQKRLIFEELLAHNLAMQSLRQKTKQFSAFPLPPQGELIKQFLTQLPFEPTEAQKRVSRDILNDLRNPFPMMRLVQGDVGSGKTLVAAIAALSVIGNGKQVALMAPTEILAEQHLQNFKKWFEPLGIEVAWLASKVKGKERSQTLEKIVNNQAKMVVGTHALFQEEVHFSDLALVIVDEQHRFGVDQRLQLREKGRQAEFYPHQLIMTATPIPRTLAMTVYADLDTSIIDELPPGRTPIQTVLLSEERRAELIARVNHACTVDKRQAYWVCTLIDESEVLEAQAATAICEDLQRLLPHLQIGLVHGRMKPAEKQAVMQAFKEGEINLLVATTVIEVGVDVPNASLMIIENAERLGLSQLHQLRGRVGRGSTASFCVLMYNSPLGKISRKRLEVMRDTQDGFVISEKDLEIRGAGEVLGTRQTGSIAFKVADLMRDRKMIPQVQETAKLILQKTPQISEKIINRWLNAKDIYSQA